MGGSKLNRQFNLKNAIFVLLVFILSLSVRLIGIDYGKPLLVHPDEENVVHSALKFTHLNNYENVTFNRPAQIQNVLTRLAMQAFSRIRFQEPAEKVFYLRQFSFYLVSRLLVVLMGSLMPIVAFFIGKEFDPDMSYIAAILFAFFPSFVRHSHFVTPDIPLSLWLMLAMLFSIYYAKGGKNWTLLLALFFCAVSTADKYPGVISLSMIAIAVLIRFLEESKAKGKFNVKGFIITGIISFVAFVCFLFLVAPLLFFKVQSVIKAIIFEGTGGHLGRDGLLYPMRVITFLNYYLIEAGWIISAFSIIGIVFFIRNKTKPGFLLLFSFIFLIAIAVVGPHHERWALPVYIGLLFCASYGIIALLDLVKQKKLATRLPQVGIAITLVLFALAGLSQSLWLNLRDTRLSGYHFLEVNEIRKEQCYYDGYTPFAPNFFPIDSDQDLSRKEEMDYAIFSSFYFRRFEHLDENEHDELRYLRKIEREGELIWSKIAEENPTTLARQWRLLKYYLKSEILKLETDHLYSGPNLYIYKLNPQISQE